MVAGHRGVAFVGFLVINSGQTEQNIQKLAPSACEIVESLGQMSTPTELAECVERDNKGKGKMLAGQILVGFAGVGLVVAFVLPKSGG